MKQFSLTAEPQILQVAIRDVKFGKRVIVVEPSNLYECTLADDVYVGPFVEIQRGVKVGANTKIQSHSFICELVEIGRSCFIGQGVVFINDLFSDGAPSGNQSHWRRTIVGNNVSIGSNATILPVRICDGCVIGAGAVLTKDALECGIYAGNPARLLRAL